MKEYTGGKKTLLHVQVTKTANRFEISSLLEKILLKQVRWCLTFVGLYIMVFSKNDT